MSEYLGNLRYVWHYFYSVMLVHIIYMTCAQCGRACFLAGCGGGDGGGGGVCVGELPKFLLGVCH